MPLYDGTSFAQKGAVLVSLNYRLGIEGFLKINGVPSNLGIRDQLAALRWVQANIAYFGGDPNNVTIFGESAGAMSVGILLASPAAKGLFQRGIMMSGSGQAVLTGEQADRVTRKFGKVLHLKNTRAAYARLTPEQLLAAQPKVTPQMVKLETEEAADPTGGLALFFPVIDGDIIPALPLQSVQQGAGAGYDLLLGYNTDEVNAFLVPTGLLKKIKLDFILNKAAQTVHPAPAALVAVYRQAYPQKTRGELFSAILTAYQFQLPSIRYADAHARLPGKTYLYEFAWPSSVAAGTYGAYHGLGLPFVFNQRALVTGPQGMLGPSGGPAELAEKIQAAWVEFAKTGSPGWPLHHRRAPNHAAEHHLAAPSQSARERTPGLGWGALRKG
ncbi:MAG: carboxylesterase family protein [Hymenobacter sp.]